MKVYTTGVFDILHRGHLNILTQAAALGELVVGIMTDEGVEATKGSSPILSLEERDAQVSSLPFVSEVIHYSDIDQRPNYALVEPDVVVQGDDWLYSSDRGQAIEYLQAHQIRLVLLPRTSGISTTEIRNRVFRSGRKDEQFLRDRLRIIPTKDLKTFEAFDAQKVQRLTSKIEQDGVFFNPLSIVNEFIVIDGANRLQSLQELGAKHAPCVVYDYTEIDLVGNVHFINDGTVTRLSEFAREQGQRIEFPKRTPDDIRAAVREGRMIPNGETFHRVPQSVIRFPIPLEELRSDVPFDITDEIERRIQGGKIRFFQSGVYVCDEW